MQKQDNKTIQNNQEIEKINKQVNFLKEEMIKTMRNSESFINEINSLINELDEAVEYAPNINKILESNMSKVLDLSMRLDENHNITQNLLSQVKETQTIIENYYSLNKHSEIASFYDAYHRTNELIYKAIEDLSRFHDMLCILDNKESCRALEKPEEKDLLLANRILDSTLYEKEIVKILRKESKNQATELDNYLIDIEKITIKDKKEVVDIIIKNNKKLAVMAAVNVLDMCLYNGKDLIKMFKKNNSTNSGDENKEIIEKIRKFL